MEREADAKTSVRRTVAGHTTPCDDCGAVDWDMDTTRGEVVCSMCGLVAEENLIDPGAEWTNSDRGEDRARTGAPVTNRLADRGLNTSIDARDLTSGGASTHGMSAQARRDWRRRRVIDERSKTRRSRERNLVKANQFIRDKSGLPIPIQEEVARIYRILSAKGFVTGRSIAGVTAACTYLVAREERLPRQIPELCESFGVDEKELSRLIRKASRELNLHRVSGPDQYFDRFLSDLGLPPAFRLEVDAMWNRIAPHEEVWQGKKPMGIAAAIIYRASQASETPRTQSEICSIANVSEVTLRGLVKTIEETMLLLDRLEERA
jgi:transcription initiation factor TFIIB